MIPRVVFSGFISIRLACGHWTHVHTSLLTETGWESSPWWCIECPMASVVQEIIRP